MQMNEYLNLIEDAGFRNIKIQSEKKIDLPDEIFHNNFPKELVDEFKQSNTGVYSITVYAEKPTSDCGCSCC